MTNEEKKLNKKLERKRNRKLYKKPKIIIAIIIICLSSYFVYYTFIKNEFQGALEQQDIQVDGTQTKTTVYDSEEVLLNPGKGFVIRDNLTRNYDDIVAVGYYRTNWDNMEPEEGKYNWEFLDSKLEDFAQRGKKFAFRIACASSSSTKQYVTPKWVFDAGAQYYTTKISDELTQVIPVWTDEVFLEKVNNFTKALAERYDGNENIAYIDIGSYGNWGEQHLGVIGGKMLTNEELQQLYINPYQNTFKKTLLVNPYGNDFYKPTYEWGIEQGITIRRDGIFGYSDGTECAMAYKKLPTIFEYTYGYNWMVSNNLWSQENLLQYVINGKPSYVEFDINMYKDNKEFCEMLANKMGYYFKFKGAEFTNLVTTKEENQIKLSFINEGVAPLYEPCTAYIGLLDKDYNLVKKYKTEIDPHTWMPDEPVEENINLQLEGAEEGKYIIALGLFLDENDENPTYLLGSTGKTDDKWYVFGEIEVKNPLEEYNIKIENDDLLINSYNGYNINIQANNLRKTSEYKIKVYINNNLSKTIDIDSSNETCNEDIELKFENGKNTYKIQIEKNAEMVYQSTKEIYVSNFTNNYQAIVNTATQKYTEFEGKFVESIGKVANLSSNIQQLKQNMINLKNVSILDENIAKQRMKDHYNLGNLVLQAYENRMIELVELNSMLDMLEDIGNSYESLVAVSAKTINPNLEQTNLSILEAETLINANLDLDIFYPSKILELSKVYYENADYINNLAENDIKTGLVVSKSLHSDLLANWANTLTNVYIDKYIEDNPVNIVYSETNITNQDVTATIVTNATIEIKNNANRKQYTFAENGNFLFEYIIKEQAFTIEASVSNIDKISPKIEGIEAGKTYIDKVVPIISDENLQKVELLADGQVVENYVVNAEIKGEGLYQIIATDQAGNVTKVSFQIIEQRENGYKIEEDRIKNIASNTSIAEFNKELNLKLEYDIYREDEVLENDNMIATGDILKTKTGDTYILIVAGDINKDGKVNIKDIVKMRKYLLERNNLDEIELLAADANLDERSISIKDLVRMRIIALTRNVT